MRTGLCIFGIVIIVGLAIGMSVPIAQAQTEDPVGVTFHVYSNTFDRSQNLETIPPDEEELIVIQGSYSGVNADHIKAYVQNLCTPPDAVGTGTPTPTVTPSSTPAPTCPTAIYYKIELNITWNSGYQDNCGLWGYCERDLPLSVSMTFGGGQNVSTQIFDCGVLGATGSCSPFFSGTLSAEDVADNHFNSTDWWNEEVDLVYSWEYGVGSYLSTTYIFTFSTTPIEEDCAGQYNIGASLASFTLAATNSAGVNLQTTMGMNYPAPGQWYAIHVVSGSWRNNGAAPDLKSLGMKVTAASTTWYPLTASPAVGCADEGADTYYVQMFSTAPVFLRVYDTDGNFSANTGSMVISISGVTAYTPYPSGCELQYEIGDLIEQVDVPANQENGRTLVKPAKNGSGGSGTDGPQPTRYYMLETIGGPANLGLLGAEQLSWDADLGPRVGVLGAIPTVPDNWYEIQTAPFVTCVVQTDLVGHVRVFFPETSQALKNGPIYDYYYSFRVRDTGSYVGNSGSLGYRLYQATSMQVTVPGETPTATGCDRYSHVPTALASITIGATSSEGYSLPELVSRNLYALEVTDGPWREGGITEHYDIELSDDNGASWEDLEDYPQLLCAASADGLHTIIYLYGAAGKDWLVRVNDQDSNFSNNTDSVGLDVFVGTTSIDEWPTCTNDYALTLVTMDDEQRKIPGNMETGKEIPATSILGASRIYSLEITDESMWYEAGTGDGSYLVEISDDGGTTWEPLEDYASLCTQQIGFGDRYQIFFTTQSNNYKLRVNDGDNNFLNNTGYAMFKLYKAAPQNYVPSPGGNPTPAPAEWIVACNEKYSRPTAFLTMYNLGTIPVLDVAINVPIPMVGEWLDYLRNAITYYFAWCPEHTAALKSISDVAMDKEPMASIQDMMSFFKGIQTTLEGYQALGGADTSVETSQEPDLFADAINIGQGTGGDSGPDAPAAKGAGMWDLFVVGTFDPATNVWFGGKVDFNASMATTNAGSNAAYEALCTQKYYPAFGIAADTVCKAFAMFRYSRIISILLLALDMIVVVWWFFKYFPGYLKKFYNLITGNRGTIKRYM